MAISDEMRAFLRDGKLTASELEAAMSEGRGRANRARITLVGPGRAGKTCVARSFLNLPFEDTPSTQGIDDLGLRTTVHQAEAREGRWGEFREFERMYEGHVALHIHDKRRSPMSLPQGEYTWRECAADATASESAEEVPATNSRIPNPESIDRRMNRRPSLDPIHMDEEYVQRTIGEIRSEGVGLVVSIHDFGGQRVFDVIHSFFLGPNGVYVVVFNMEWMLSEFRDSCLDHLQSWVNALIVHSSITDECGELKCASIVLVGTHKDSVPDALIHQDICKTLTNLLIKSVAWKSLLENDSEGLCFFPVDCSQGQADPSIVNLMKVIEADILQSDYLNVERPLTFFKVLDKMNERKKTVSYLSLDEVTEMANKCKVGSDGLVEDMLRFFRDMGLVMWHEEPSLRKTVILDPVKFFVSPATNIVCQHREDEQGTVHSNELLKKARKRYPKDFEVMRNEGMISSTLLKFILHEYMKKETQSGELLFDRIEAVMNLLTKYNLLVPMFDKVKEDELSVTIPHEYLVPSILPLKDATLQPNQNSLYIYCYVEGSVDTKLFNHPQDIESSCFIPPGLFQRYVARIVAEVDATRGGQSFKFSFRNQASFFIGRTKISVTALPNKGNIKLEFEGEAVYGPLKLLEAIMAEVKLECYHKLEAVTMAPFPAIGNEIRGLIRLDTLYKTKSDFEFMGIDYSVCEMKAAYAKFLQPNFSNQPFDVFISYRWGEYQKTIVRFLYSRLSRTLIQDDNNLPLRVYLDEKENDIGDNFAYKFCSAFKGLGVFLPLISGDALNRMKNHDPSIIDYVLAEWIIALSTGCRVLPILVGYWDANCWKELNLKEHRKDLPSVYPEKTVKFVKEQLKKVEMMGNVQEISETSEWTVKSIVERFFLNLYLNWETNSSFFICRSRILAILNESRSSRRF